MVRRQAALSRILTLPDANRCRRTRMKRGTMNMKSQRPFALIVAFAMLLSLASVTMAQDQPTTGKARHRMQTDSAQATGHTTGSSQHPFPHGPGFSWMSAEMRFGHKTVTGAPFSAQIEIESTQT